MSPNSGKFIDGFSVENILQISSLEKKSLTLKVSALDRLGYLYIADGDLVDAVAGDKHGYDAAVDILCWEGVQVRLMDPEPRDRSIDLPLMKILLNASKEKDERSRDGSVDVKEQLEAAIELAEAHKYTSAHKQLVAYLKKHKNNAGGWVWYSRVHGKLEAMEKALKVAHHLGPNDPLVQEERRMFGAAKKKLTGTNIRKCFFCWTPLDKQSRFCHNCSGYLTINKDALVESERPASGPFTTAVRRYSRVCDKYPESQASRYSLCLANLNLGRLNDALHHIDLLVKQVPGNKMFTNQLNMLMTFLASTIPADQESGPDPSVEVKEEVVPGTVSATVIDSPKNVLVVEDSPTIRKVITIALKRNGYAIDEAGDGLEALSCVSQKKPDLILLDVVLPKMDGFKILSILKGNNEFRDIPVIMLTSKDGIINKVKGKMAGAAAYLTKPFDPQEMIGEIEKHL